MGKKHDTMTLCYLAAGSDANAGRLLFKLLWLLDVPRMYHERAGRRWVTMTREEWMVELAITRNVYDRIRAKLARLTLIDVEHHPLSIGGVLRATWMSPTDRLYGLVYDESPGNPGNQSSAAPDNSSSGAADHLHISTGDIYKESLPIETSKQPKAGEIVGGVTGPEVGDGSKAKASISLAEVPKAKVGGRHLEALWRQEVSKRYPGPVIWGGKERGQLSLIMRKVQPHADPEKFLERVLNSWATACEAAIYAAGSKGAIPGRPSVGYVLANLEAMLAWYDAEEKEFVQSAPKPKPNVQTGTNADKSKEVPVVKEAPLTLEELEEATKEYL